MKDQYAGDIGDFGKYGLLRALCKDGIPKLGMAWWMTCDDKFSNDGKFTTYLRRNDKKLKDCDPDLFDALARMERSGTRSVEAVCNLGVLPDGTVHHLKRLHFERGSPRDVREFNRDMWLSQAVHDLTHAQLIFADPDNCLSESAKPLQRRGPKYAFPHEIAALSRQDKSMIVYQHLARNGSATEQLDRGARILQGATKANQRPWVLWYHRGTARGFLISPAERHRELLRSRLDSFLAGPWGRYGHFEEVR